MDPDFTSDDEGESRDLRSSASSQPVVDTIRTGVAYRTTVTMRSSGLHVTGLVLTQPGGDERSAVEYRGMVLYTRPIWFRERIRREWVRAALPISVTTRAHGTGTGGAQADSAARMISEIRFADRDNQLRTIMSPTDKITLTMTLTILDPAVSRRLEQFQVDWATTGEQPEDTAEGRFLLALEADRSVSLVDRDETSRRYFPVP